MNILHVLSQFEVTGAEAYAAALSEAQIARGHSATIVSDTFTFPTRATYVPLPVGIRSYPRRIRNIVTLVNLIRSGSIDIIHAHSRAASWVSLFAAYLTRTPFVSTVHGRQHVHTSSKAFNVYGSNIIAVSAALQEHLVQDLHFNPRDIVVIPNCIAMDKWDKERISNRHVHEEGKKEENLIIFVGRLTGPKGDVVRLLLTEILPGLLRVRRVRFKAIGAMIVPDDIPKLVAQLNQSFGRKVVELLGFRQGIARDMLEADLIIGSGRVVPESLVLQRPVIAFGESEYAGPIFSGSFETAALTNFGDTGRSMPADCARISAEIVRMLERERNAEHSCTTTI